MIQPDDPNAASSADASSFERWIHPPLTGCWYLTGPTCSGKTLLAVEVAKRLDAEILSLDSMAIYIGMDLGTAKPTVKQQAEVKHHLIDILEPTESFSVSNYVVAAHAAAKEIWSRGRNVLVCGGTPLYLKGLIRGLFLGPAADWEFRNSVEEELKQHGEEALRNRLMQVDPLLAHKLHPHDHRRMIRALEVARITGRPLSHWQQQFDTPSAKSQCAVAVLQLERAWLHERINERVESMISGGLPDEVAHLLKIHGKLGRTASQAVGYRETLEYLVGGVPLDKTVERIKAHTRQFARRQEIWFRGLEELQGIRVNQDSSLDRLADEIVAILDQCPQQESTQDGN